jgi:hypothetical protein
MPEVENNTTEETVDVDSSILLSVKKVIGLTPDDVSFDTDIIMHINSAFFKLKQLNVFQSPYSITDSTATWSDCLGEDEERLCAVKTYITLYVRYIFDPNTNGTLHNAMKSELTEMEQRFIYECDPPIVIPST